MPRVVQAQAAFEKSAAVRSGYVMPRSAFGSEKQTFYERNAMNFQTLIENAISQCEDNYTANLS